jgi:hypothetical protein
MSSLPLIDFIAIRDCGEKYGPKRTKPAEDRSTRFSLV